MTDTTFTYHGIEFGTNLTQTEIDTLLDALGKYERGEEITELPDDLIPYFDYCAEHCEKRRTIHHRPPKRKKNQRKIKNRLRKRNKKQRGA